MAIIETEARGATGAAAWSAYAADAVESCGHTQAAAIRRHEWAQVESMERWASPLGTIAILGVSSGEE